MSYSEPGFSVDPGFYCRSVDASLVSELLSRKNLGMVGCLWTDHAQLFVIPCLFNGIESRSGGVYKWLDTNGLSFRLCPE